MLLSLSKSWSRFSRKSEGRGEMVIPENAQASLENGVLRINLRKYKKKAEKEFILKIRQSKD